MKVNLKKNALSTRLNLGDIVILNLIDDTKQDTPFLVVGIDQGQKYSMINLSTLQEGTRFRQSNLYDLTIYLRNSEEFVRVIKSENIEIKEI